MEQIILKHHPRDYAKLIVGNQINKMDLLRTSHLKERNFSLEYSGLHTSSMEQFEEITIWTKEDISLEFHVKNKPEQLVAHAYANSRGVFTGDFYPQGINVYRLVEGEKQLIGIAKTVKDLDSLTHPSV